MLRPLSACVFTAQKIHPQVHFDSKTKKVRRRYVIIMICVVLSIVSQQLTRTITVPAGAMPVRACAR